MPSLTPSNLKRSHADFTTQHRVMGKFAAWAVFFLGIVYVVTLVLGLLSLESPQAPIGDPFFTLLELLILAMTPLMVISMVAVHAYAAPSDKAYSLTALAFMILLVSLTSSVHFVILTVSRQIEAAGLPWGFLFFSFKWPSVAYALDILAWDLFFALSMLSAASVFRESKLERKVKVLMIISGVMSLAGLIGVPLGNMQIRMIGVLGYAVVSPVVFLLLGILFGHIQENAAN